MKITAVIDVSFWIGRTANFLPTDASFSKIDLVRQTIRAYNIAQLLKSIK